MKKLTVAAMMLAVMMPLSGAHAQDSEENMVPPPTGAELSTIKKDNFTVLLNEINKLKSPSALTADQKQAVEKSLSALAQGEVRPSEENIKALATVVSRATVNAKLTEAQIKKLSGAFLTILDSETGTQAAAKTAVKTVQSAYSNGGVKVDAGAMAKALETILDELAKKSAEVAG